MIPGFLDKNAGGASKRAVDNLYERALLQVRVRQAVKARFDDRPHRVDFRVGNRLCEVAVADKAASDGAREQEEEPAAAPMAVIGSRGNASPPVAEAGQQGGRSISRVIWVLSAVDGAILVGAGIFVFVRHRRARVSAA